MVKSHACHTFEPKYLVDYSVMKIINDSTLLVVTPNGRECKINSKDVKLASTLKPIENAWDSFLTQ